MRRVTANDCGHWDALKELCREEGGKPWDRGFDSRWGREIFFDYGPGVDSASNTNEFQVSCLRSKGGWCVRLTTLPHSCADFLKILGAWSFWGPRGLSSHVQEYLKKSLVVNLRACLDKVKYRWFNNVKVLYHMYSMVKMLPLWRQ